MSMLEAEAGQNTDLDYRASRMTELVRPKQKKILHHEQQDLRIIIKKLERLNKENEQYLVTAKVSKIPV